MAARRTTAEAPARRTRTATPTRRPRRARVAVLVVPRLVEDDTEVLAAEHAACDAQLLDLVSRISA